MLIAISLFAVSLQALLPTAVCHVDSDSFVAQCLCGVALEAVSLLLSSFEYVCVDDYESCCLCYTVLVSVRLCIKVLARRQHRTCLEGRRLLGGLYLQPQTQARSRFQDQTTAGY